MNKRSIFGGMNRYVVAVLLTAAAVGLRLVLDSVFGPTNQSFVVVFCGAAIAAAWYGGFRAGLLSTALGSLALVSLFTEPRWSLLIEQADDQAALLSLVVTSLVGCWLCATVHADRPLPRSGSKAAPRQVGTMTSNQSAAPRSNTPPPSFWWLGCFVLANLVAAGAGQGLKLIPGVSITFWPPAGIFVAALLLTDRAKWPWWVAGAGVAELIGNALWFHNPLHLAILYFAANTATAMTASHLVTRAVGRASRVVSLHLLEAPRNAALFAMLAAGVAPVVGAAIIATADAVLGKHTFWNAWLLVWLGDGTGLLLSAPLTLAVVHAWRCRGRIRVERTVEFAGTCGLTLLLAWLALRGYLPTVYMTLPAVVWAAVRFRLRGAWAVLTAVILTVAVVTRSGLGEFAGTPDQMGHHLVALQVFLAVCALTALIVAGLSTQHVRALARLRAANQRLEHRVLDRTAALREAGQQLLLSLKVGHAAAFTWDIPTDKVRILHDGIAPSRDATAQPDTFEAVLATIHPDDQDTFERRLRHAIERLGPEEYTNEYRRVWPDGSVRWIIDTGRVEFDVGGKPLRLVGLSTDITARKVGEEQLRESEHRLRLTMAAAATGLWEWDVATNVVTWSPECYSIHGIKEGQFDGTAAGFDRLIHPNDRSRVWATVLAAVDGWANYNCDFRIVRPDGEVRWVANMGRAVNADGGRVKMIGTVTDITDRKQAEEALRESEARLSGILRQSPAGIVQTDAAGCMTLVNPRWCQMLGYPEAELLGKSVIAVTHPSSVAATTEAFGRLAAGGPDFQIQTTHCRKDGSLLQAQTNVTAVRWPDGTFRGLIAVVVDMTERLRIEEEMRRVAFELSAADRRKNEFLATLAHELRNPLAPIRNGLQLMRLASGNWATVEQVRDMIDRQLDQMVRLVDDLMDVSRISTGKVQLRKERVALAVVVQCAVETSRPLIEQMGHDLTVTLPEHPLDVEVDLTRLAQILLNLLNNAAKYSERNSPIWLIAKQQGDELVVSVKDAGIGIPTDQLPRVFDMFAQVDHALEKSQGGLGIGLCLVKRLVELHGGRIEARSEGPGKGSEFIVRLPVVVESFPPPEEASRPEEHNPVLRILIVDDNGDSADSLAMMLEILGNETCTAYDGEEAVSAAGRFRPDVILLDIGLPKLNGYEACRRIRGLERGKEMVIVAQTGWGQEEDRQRTHEAGFDHHYVKPVDLQVLMKLLRSLSHQ